MKNRIYKVFIILVLLVLFFIKPNVRSTINPELLTIYSIIFIGSLVLHFQNYEKNNKNSNWSRLDVFFLLGFTIVHFQWPIMYGISNIIPEVPNLIWVDELFVNYGTWLSSVGGVSWILGFSIIRSKSLTRNKSYVLNYNKLLNLTIFLFFLFLATAGKDFLTGGVYKGSGGSAAGEGISAYIQILFSISIILLTGLIIIDNKNNYENNLFKWFFSLKKRYLFLYFTYVFLFLMIGDRGGPIFLVITTFTLIGTIIKPLKLPFLLMSIFIGGIFLSIISLGRTQKSGIGILSAGAEKFELSSGYDNTLELANSVRTLYMAVSHVPEKRNFFYGKLWVGNLIAPVPFAQSVYLDLANTERHEIGSAGYITYLTFGPYSSSGEGTSLIADIYLNFAVFGVVFFMFLLGLLFKKSDNSLKSFDSLKWIIIAIILASSSIYFGRGSLFHIIRPIIWSIILMIFFVKVDKVKI